MKTAGSHTPFIGQTPNLRVFRRIFEEHGQIGHYRMMMGEPVEEVSAEDQAVEVESGSEAIE
jgi:hypothetical protein